MDTSSSDSSSHLADCEVHLAIDPIQRGVLRFVLYFDVFRHPVTLGELVRMVAPHDRTAVDAACDALERRGLIEALGRYRFRPGMSRFIPQREERARQAEKVWPAARRAARLLASLPYMRGVLITGSLSKLSAQPGDDIDFLLLVEPGRVWTVKSALQGFRRLLPDDVRELFCTNYLLDTAHLQVDDRNLYTAVELATALPMAGRQACLDLFRDNAWAADFVPGFDWAIERAAHVKPDRKRRVRPLEWMLAGPVGPAVEKASLAAWDRYWNHKYHWLPDDVRAQRFKRREEIATNHLHDFQDFVLREVSDRFRQVGLDESVGPIPQAGL